MSGVLEGWAGKGEEEEKRGKGREGEVYVGERLYLGKDKYTFFFFSFFFLFSLSLIGLISLYTLYFFPRSFLVFSFSIYCLEQKSNK